ncbi:TraB domain-containing protein [Porphyridium purpureum]|uniref:TraB domain-containing protein n=1 Tax=Porphyridium purpureum TaxID=35688 RepID=A0A5J4YZ00_PORPP|nr:TraB domain-containing protein [Porphyridium purpureum]|eukprot:POR3677..scf209_3
MRQLLWRALGGVRAASSTASSIGAQNIQLSDTNPVVVRSLRTGAELYLIGTIHLGKGSTRAVSDLIRVVQPNEVYVELDRNRANIMRERVGKEKPQEGFLASILKEIGKMDLPFGQADHMNKLPGVIEKATEIFSKLNVLPGSELLEAIKEAERIQGCDVVYFDKEQDDIVRALLKAGLKDLDKILINMLTPHAWSDRETPFPEIKRVLEGIEGERELDRPFVRTIVQSMRDSYPNVTRALLDERDEFMAKQLQGARGRVVAVVGMAHMDGIERAWRELDSHSTFLPIAGASKSLGP